jgi:hypothetical protein
MITPIHDDVHPPFGLLFTGNFPVTMDEYTGISERVKQYPDRSTRAGETMKWWCAWGAVLFGTRGLGVAGPYGAPL